MLSWAQVVLVKRPFLTFYLAEFNLILVEKSLPIILSTIKTLLATLLIMLCNKIFLWKRLLSGKRLILQLALN